MTSSLRFSPDRLRVAIVGASGNGGPEERADDGLRVLKEVEARRDREAAFGLLTADALLTLACEEALEGSHPGLALEGVLDRVVEALA